LKDIDPSKVGSAFMWELSYHVTNYHGNVLKVLYTL